jgi:hypothetical protein
MSIRFWRSLGLAVLIAFVAVTIVSAKGGYSFITIAGPDLQEAVRTTDAALTEDFFAFADFYRDRVDAPQDPGVGYEITRYYLDGAREIAFDRLHYYPSTGFVYYDGIINGSSEYDKKWYAADPEIRSVFDGILVGASISPSQKIDSAMDGSGENVNAFSQPSTAFDRTTLIISLATAAGLAVTILLLFSRRKVFSQ